MRARDELWRLYQFPGSASDFGDALDRYTEEISLLLEHKAANAALSRAAYELRQNAGSRETGGEDRLAAYGRELADLIDPAVKP